jgi:UDP-glucose 4-epimerase
MEDGVAGFIGSNLAISLLNSGFEVIGIDNLSYGFLSNINEILNNKNFTFINGDLTNPLSLIKYKADIIIHLASQKIPRYTNALRTLDENNLMLKNIIQKCLIDKSRLIFSSTSDVYGKSEKIPFSEESDLMFGPSTVKRWAYAISKLYSEQYIIANHEEYNLNYTIMRFFGSYGPKQNLTWWGGPQSVFIQNILEKKPMEIHGSGDQTRTFTYIDDTIQGIEKCIFSINAKNEIFNISTNPDDEISILELSKLIFKLMNNNENDFENNVKYIPYSNFGKYEDVKRRVPDISKIKNMLNFEPKFSLIEGLIKTIDWQKNILKK